MTYGKIMKNTPSVWKSIGGAQNEKTGMSYVLAVDSTDASPLVCNLTTGKIFTLSWNDLVEMAQEKGIDDANE